MSATIPEEFHWRVTLDSVKETRLVSVSLAGAQQPAFEISRNGVVVKLVTHAMAENGAPVRYFASLREAVLAICPLDDEEAVAANESMEVLYPRHRDGV